jgi:glycolate oxidase FAD binding subunit
MDAAISKLSEQIQAAASGKQPLRLRAGGTKDFYGRALTGEILDLTHLNGVVDYEPTELVITVRAGTPVAEVERVLRAGNQMLAFEPPHFGPTATIGGCVAAGLSGPRRAAAGSLRDFVLGVRILDGRGNELRFGGQVMKNVAGYDVSRAVAGSLGTLGLLLDVSLKVLPLPPVETTVRFGKTAAEAIAAMNEWAGKPLPISATCHVGNDLTVRLSGAAAAVKAARAKLGGDEVADGAAFWQQVREQQASFFSPAHALWRISLKPTTPPLNLPGPQLMEWGGALRWLSGDGSAETVRKAAQLGGGHATLFRGGDKAAGVFHPMPAAMMKLHQNLKQELDPAGVFNAGRMYDWL